MQFKVSLSGQLGLQVKDSRALLTNFMGTTNSLENASFLDKDFSTAESGKTLGGFYRGILVQNVNAALPSIIAYNKLSLATINEHYRVLGEKIRESLDAEFAKIGLSVPDFTLESIFFPQIPENENYHNLVKMKNASVMDKKATEHEMERDNLSAELGINKTRNRTAQAEAEAMAKRKLQGVEDDTEIIHETKETEKLRIAEEQRLIVEHNDLSLATENMRAFGEASGDVLRVTGMAEADVLKAKGVAASDVLRAKGMAEADTMKAKGYTEIDTMKHQENMEINKQLPNLGMYFEQKDKDEFSKEIIRESLAIEKERAPWNCSCGSHGVTGAFCPNCGAKKATVTTDAAWTCPNCNKAGNTENFCADCGAKRPSVITSWNCACGKSNISSKFCPNCGKERP
jgi:regulator of protease activity HflC (stomatin/prohibitin superfamily)